MEANTVIPRADVCKLIGENETQLKNFIHAGYWLPWYDTRQPIAIDCVLYECFRLIVKYGHLRSDAVRLALPGMQSVLAAGVDRPGTYILVALARNNTLACGCGTLQELAAMKLYSGDTYAATWRLNLEEPIGNIRARAKKHKIILPEKFAPPDYPAKARTLPFEYKDPAGKVKSEWSAVNPVAQMVVQ